jgi:hypothetical protein
MANPAPITLDQLFRFHRGLPHQLAAIVEMEDDIKANGYAAAMRRDRPWFSVWSQDGRQPEQEPAQAIRPANPLARFPWLPQLDNGPEGWRQCQTSSIAMCLAYLGAGGIRDDLDYLRVVQRFGDTTSQDAHRQALASLGVRARFVQHCTAAQAQARIRGGLPVAMGILHHGPVAAPSGGGHWIAAYGFDADGWIVNDPYGELNLVRGGWAKVGGDAGKGQRYSYRNLNPRWLAEGPSSGWAWLFS